MKRISLVVVWCAFAATASAEKCDWGETPAATLLLPYFEVDLEDPSGLTTVFSINNALPVPTVAKVTLWTDYAIPTINWDVFLTGYDVETISLGSVFHDFLLPVTASRINDPDDTLSPAGRESWDGDFENCGDFLPIRPPGVPFPEVFGQFMRNAHTGRPTALSPSSEACLGSAIDDGIARGYVTIDNVNRCSVMTPADADYFGDRGSGVASNVNQLWGDYFLIDPSAGVAQGESMVHIEAFEGVGEDGAWQDGDLTFYGRYVERSAIDNREPLPSVWAARYISSGNFDSDTELLIWRDTNDGDASWVSCDERPAWFPLWQHQIMALDQTENVSERCAFFSGDPPSFPPACIPLATQKIDPDTPFDFGWTFIDLNEASPTTQYVDTSQGWIVSRIRAGANFSVGISAVPLHSACQGPPPGFQF